MICHLYLELVVIVAIWRSVHLNFVKLELFKYFIFQSFCLCCSQKVRLCNDENNVDFVLKSFEKLEISWFQANIIRRDAVKATVNTGIANLTTIKSIFLLIKVLKLLINVPK